jgi:hypothetical protein
MPVLRHRQDACSTTQARCLFYNSLFPIPYSLFPKERFCLTGRVKIKVAPSPGVLRAGNSAAVALDNFTTDCQTDASAFVGAASVQSLENRKNTIAIFFIKTDAVVNYLYFVHLALSGSFQFY